MNNNQTDENKTSLEQNNYVDPRTINAQVIGELRKDKIGKPILVLEMFALFAIVLIALPLVTGMLNDETSALYKLVYGSTVITPTPSTPVSEFQDGSIEQPLLSSTKMKMNNIVMSDFSFSGNELKFKMYSYNGLINMDEEPYFLEIYSNSKALLGTFKLTGTFDYQEQDIVLSSGNMNFNKNYSYFAKIVIMEDEDYPSVTITSDESGIGSLTCKKDGNTIEYVFKNGYLINIKDTDHVKFSGKDNNEYLRLKREYESKSSALSGISTIQEVTDGFIFTANIDLESYQVPSSVVDYDYYKLDTEAKVVNYTQIGKGFDCK